MELQTFQYGAEKGWSVDTFPDLDSDNTLILVFAAPEFIQHPEPLQQLAKRYPLSKMIGCSSAGEISGAHLVDNSLSVAVAKFDKTHIKIVASELNASDCQNAFHTGQNISSELNAPDLRGIFVLSGGLNVNGSELVSGLNLVQKPDVVITGGLAGDGSRFKQTWTIFNGKILTDKVVAVGLYGQHIHIGHGSRGGWDIFGPERRITHSNGNILLELDGRPALALYREYLGEKAGGLPATGLLFPLAIRKSAEDPKQLVRTILGINEKDQSLTFAGDMPTGYLAQLMRANFDRLISGAHEAGQLANNNLPDQKKLGTSPVLAVAISCVGRRLLLSERTEEETESTMLALPSGTQQVGFYSYGELSPYSGNGNCVLHNQTMTLTTICEN